MLRRFLKDSVLYVIPAFISRGLNFILIPLYTRVLNPADFGSLDLFIIFASIVNVTIALEVSQGVARFYASESNLERKMLYASSAFWFTFGCYVIFLGIVFLFSARLAELIMGQVGLQLEFQIGVIYIFVSGIFYLIQNQFRWELRTFHYAIVSITMTVVTAGISVWLTYFLQWGLLGILVGMLSGSALATVLGLWWLLRSSYQFRFSNNQLKEMLYFSMPLVFSGIAIWVSLYVDRMMINHFLSIYEVGLYGMGYRLASIGSLIMIGFQGALTPLIYSSFQNPGTPEQVAKIFRIFLFFGLMIFLFLTLFAVDILIIIASPDFYDASIVVVFLVPAILLSNMYIFSPGIGIAKKTYLTFLINIIGCLLNVGLNYWLIPLIGITGAAMATMVSYFCIFTMYVVIGQRYYPIPHRWNPIIISVLITSIIIGVFYYLNLSDSVRFAASLFTLLSFPLIALKIKLIQRDEILWVWNFFRQRILIRS